jgi:hypothetical protein
MRRSYRISGSSQLLKRRAFTGRLLNQDTFTVQILDSTEHLRSFSRTDLREFTILNNSPMPSYKDKLSSQELADIVSYLASLKAEVNP